MATRHRIDNALKTITMGDVEKYFSELSNIVENNSGTHDCKIISHDCYNTAAPVHSNQFTRFKLTDQAMDIVDLGKAYISATLEMDVMISSGNGVYEKISSSSYKEAAFKQFYFIGFKSSAHIIDVYNVYSNGLLTNCKQTKARHEQFITYASKGKEERAGRPGMYSPHENVREMSECVCGAYIEMPKIVDIGKPIKITFDVIIQIDDLLPFSAMEYYPRFLTGDLELELSPSLTQNMVFCSISPMAAIELGLYTCSVPGYVTSFKLCDGKMDYKFHACGDYTDGYLPYVSNSGEENPDTLAMLQFTLIPSNLKVVHAKSYIHGFNIKSEAKQNLLNMFSGKNLVIPAQWVDHYTFSQLPTATSIRTNIQIPMFNATQAIITFPKTSNELVVSQNPHLEAVQCQISDRIIPDKFFSTLDKAHAEMILEALNFDSLFTASESLIEALSRKRQLDQYGSSICSAKDDTDYILVFNLERFGNGCYCDGLTDNPVPVNFQANFIDGTKNIHYYKGNNFRPQNLNLFIVSDAFWVCNQNGCQFVKDIATKF